MRKSFLWSMIGIAAIGITSCSNEVDGTPSLPDGTPVSVSFTTTLPDALGTRAVTSGNGLSCNQLFYAVFETESGKLVDSGTDTGVFGNQLTATHTFNLITGREYDFLFFASNSAADNVYTISADKKSVMMNSGNFKANAENYDAFYNQELKLKITGNMNRNIELTRPFAQLNIGTTAADLTASAAAGFTLAQTQVQVPVYGGFSLMDGSVIGTADTKTFALADISAIDGDFPVAGYNYIGLNYLLVDQKELVTVNFKVATAGGADSQEFSYANVPVQRNYRTNIYGNLLTSSFDYVIEINPAFEGEYPYAAWDGTTIEAVTPVTETIDGVDTPVYHVSNGAQLAYMAQTSGLNKSHIVLDGDIDLGGNDWIPLGGANRKGKAMFEGTFDGKGNVISNFKSKETDEDMCAALIGAATNATIKNVTVRNAQVSGYDSAAGLVGYLGDNSSITDCDVEVALSTIYVNPGSKVIGQAYGGVVARVYGKNVTISGCTTSGTVVANSGLNAQSKIGGIVGLLGTNLATGLVIDNCTNGINMSGISDFGMAGIVCMSPENSDITIKNCVNNGNLNNSYPGSDKALATGNVGGIIGYMQTVKGLTIENNTNNGDLSAKGGPIGGIYGKLFNCENVTETENTNNGTINSL